MQFHFSIRNTVQNAWQLFTKHAALYIVIALVMTLLNLGSRRDDSNILVMIASSILSVVVTYVIVSVTLAVVDGKEDKVANVKSATTHLPTFMQWLRLIGVGIVVSLPIVIALGLAIVFGMFGFSMMFTSIGGTIAIGIAFMLLVVLPVIYITIRLMFANMSFIDRQKGIGDALRHSSTVTLGCNLYVWIWSYHCISGCIDSDGQALSCT
jgi:hypothetical protein